MKLIYRFLIIVALASALGVAYHAVWAQSCGSEEECRKLISEYESKLTSVRQQKNTLASQIQFFDTQIYLTSLRVIDAQNKIKKTQDEIDSISGRIVGLNESLDHVTKLLINKIAESYKRRDVPLLSIFIDSNNASILTNRLKYSKTAEQNDQKLALEVQQAKNNFEKQKNLREQKKAQLDNLSKELVAQQSELKSQQESKRVLLTQTQSSEATYQNLLSQAQAQLSSFKSFVVSSGASSPIGANSFGAGSDGNYYSQRDERWAGKTIGQSPESIIDVGCLLTSISMVAKKLGQNLTPADVASQDRFWLSTAWMRFPWPGVAGRTYQSVSNIDQELQSGNYVIVGVGACSNGGSHYVVLTKKDGGDYIMHDPIYGPDLKFSSHYANICSSATFK
jgi:peptidoglycan hydrolase CwlO-like protein